jgi:chromosome segregation ATPase
MCAFHSWKCRAVAKRRPVGCDETELRERALGAEGRIRELKSAIEAERRTTNETRVALEASVKNERKMKAIIRKQRDDKRAVRQKIQATEKKYENELTRYMLELKLRSESIEQRAAELQESLNRCKTDKTALSNSAQELESAHQRELDEFQMKLHSAFEITSEFRREIGRLEFQLDSVSLSHSAKSSPGNSSHPEPAVTLYFS